MQDFPLKTKPFLLTAFLAMAAASVSYATEPDVVDPITGETVSISEIDFDTLTEEQRHDIGDQLVEQGYSLRERPSDRPDLSDVSVVDPTTGETVSLSEIDIESLSDEDRRAIGDQLAEQNVNPGHHGKPGGERSSDAERSAGGRGPDGEGPEGEGPEGEGPGGEGGPSRG